MKSAVFIGSSTEKMHVAEAIEVNLNSVADVSSWKHSFRLGQTFFSELLEFKDRFDFAVIVLTADDILQSRGVQHNVPRDNVVFELGLFLGSLGPDRVFAIVDENVDTKIMTDYSGVSFLTYNGNRSDGDLNQALSPACVRIKQAIGKQGARPVNTSAANVHFPGSLIGLQAIHENWNVAERQLLADLRSNPGPIRLFFHIASQSIGLSGSFFDIIDSIVQEGRVDIRILHASPDSPLFARDRLLALGKRPERVLASLKYVDDSLRQLEAAAQSSLRRRSHDHPFLWRIYGLSDHLYFMPYFSNKDATKSSPVLVFRKEERSLYHTFTAWFDDVWNRSAPKRVRLGDLVSPATPSGTALFLHWDGRHAFGIPKRDVLQSKSKVRIYGLGGKRIDSQEAFEDCALREGNEEANGSVGKLVSSDTTDFFRADGAIIPIDIIGEKTVPRLIYEKREHTGRGAMKKGDDSYYVVGYDAEFSQRPRPSGELGALVYLDDNCLRALAKHGSMLLSDLLAEGALIDEQDGFVVPRDSRMEPHGTALYLLRLASAEELPDS